MSRVRYFSTLWLLGGLLAGCGEDLMAPPGAIEITSITAGEPTDPDGYTIAVDGVKGSALGTNSTLTVSDLAPGNHELALSGTAPNCVLTGANPRTVSVTSGATAHTTFELECNAPAGSIEVTTVTTGESPDPDGYSPVLDGAAGPPIGSNGTITFAGVAAGNHIVILTGVAPNCAVGGENPRTVTVGTEVVGTRFEITCRPPTGSIVISTTTAGPRPDLDGYAVSVDGSSGQAIGTNGTLTLSALSVGDHTMQLSGVAPNCTVGGENPRVVTVTNGGADRAAFQVSCFPNGEGIILFTSDRTGTSHLYSMREDGSRIVDLTPSAEACCGDWSPDGKRIVFSAEAGISVMNQDGSSPVGLGVSGGDVSWSPDGRKILFTSGRTFTTDGMIEVMNADGSGVTVLTTGGSPDWSPDGTRIAFQRTGPCVVDICGADVYVMADDGSQVRKLTNSQGAFDFFGLPAWSPDGRKIAYRRSAFFGGSGLYVMNPDGSDKTSITAMSGMGHPVWSPDGSAIAFAGFSADGGTPQLTVIPSTGGTGVVLASSPGSEYPDSWK